MSARLLTRLKRQDGGILCNGKPIRTIDPVQNGDLIELRLNDTHVLEAASTQVPVAYEDAQLVVFNKPTGMPVHPSVHHQGDTLGNCFSGRYPGLSFRAVNRLDRDTSGLCLVAKSAYAANQVQFRVQKRYYAVVCGILTEDGTVNAPIAREQESIILRCVSAQGCPAVTHYHVLGHTDRYTALCLTLETGRTHQIRVHMAHIGHPLAGDAMYGGDCTDLSVQALHCGWLRFPVGATGQPIAVSAPCRDEMCRLVPDAWL